jgi:RNA polymerase sigma-70 factor, ECF subfamily
MAAGRRTMPSSPGRVTDLLREVQEGHPDAEGQLVQLVYSQLRQSAARLLRSERSNHTLQPTALVHEAYLRLMRSETPTAWIDRAHFFGTATRVMRQILVDYARKRVSIKRGSGEEALPLDDSLPIPEVGHWSNWIVLDELLDRLGQIDPRQCRIVEMRVLGGMTTEEVAQVLGVGLTTVKLEWRLAKAWLRNEMEG